MSEIQTNQIGHSMSLDQIKEMIDQLSQTETGQPLKNAMNDLQRALLDNPAACAIMGEEDIGEMVKNLYRMNGQIIAEEAGKVKTRKPKVEMTAESMKALEDDLFDGE